MRQDNKKQSCLNCSDNNKNNAWNNNKTFKITENKVILCKNLVKSINKIILLAQLQFFFELWK